MDGDGASAAGDLDHVVGMMRDGHELREGGVAEDGVVGQANVRDVEVDELAAVVLLRAKGDSELDLPQRLDGSAGDSREGPGGHEPLVGHLKCLESLDGNDVQACTPIDERLGDGDVVDGGGAD